MTELSLPDPDTIRHRKVKITTTAFLIFLISFVCVSVFTENYIRQQNLHKPFAFVDSTVQFLTYEDALKDVNETISREYVAQMLATNEGYTYLGYTFAIEKTSYDERYWFYTVHFQWWAKR